MNRIISKIIDILLVIVLIGAIQALSFSSMVFILEYFKGEITIGISSNVLCLAIAASLTQVWIFFYFIFNTNILKYREKKNV